MKKYLWKANDTLQAEQTGHLSLFGAGRPAARITSNLEDGRKWKALGGWEDSAVLLGRKKKRWVSPRSLAGKERTVSKGKKQTNGGSHQVDPFVAKHV